MVTINELIDVIEQAAGIKMKRTYNLAAPTGLKGRGVDISKARETLGWAPACSTSRGDGENLPLDLCEYMKKYS